LSILFTKIREEIPAQVTNPRVRRLALLWQQAAERAGGLPCYDLLEPAAQLDVADHLVVAEPDGDDFRYRYYGRAIAATDGRDMVGRHVSDFRPALAEFLTDQYREAIETGALGYTIHHAPEGEPVASWERLVMPAVRADGRPVVVGFVLPQDQDADLLDGIMRTSADPIFILRSAPGCGQDIRDLDDFQLVTVNRHVHDLLGLAGEVVEGLPLSRVALNDRDALLANLIDVWRTGRTRSFRRVLETRYGQRHYNVSASKAGGKIIAIYNNVTELVEAQQAMEAQKADLERANRRLRDQARDLARIASEREEAMDSARQAHRVIADVIETIPAPVFFRSYETGAYEIVNQHYADLYGGDKTRIEGRPVEEFMTRERHDLIEKLHCEVYRSAEGYRAENLELDYEGRGRRMMQANLAVIHNLDGSPRGIVGVLLDVTEEHELRQSLERAATTDPLTGLANRRRFFHQAGLEIDRCRRYDHPLSLIMFDIDHFKRVNDSHGHEGGDAVLVSMAKVIQATIRGYVDVAARIGGEEFVVLTPETDLDAAAQLAERLRRAIAGMTTSSNGVDIRVTASFGVCEMSLLGEPIEKALSRADEALYAAKASGRNRVVKAASVPADRAASGS